MYKYLLTDIKILGIYILMNEESSKSIQILLEVNNYITDSISYTSKISDNNNKID